MAKTPVENAWSASRMALYLLSEMGGPGALVHCGKEKLTWRAYNSPEVLDYWYCVSEKVVQYIRVKA